VVLLFYYYIDPPFTEIHFFKNHFFVALVNIIYQKIPLSSKTTPYKRPLSVQQGLSHDHCITAAHYREYL
jgi:hypothetical protein